MSAQERYNTSFFLSPSLGSPLPSSDGTALRNEKWQKKWLLEGIATSLNTWDFCNPETILFASFWVSPPSKFRRCIWREFESQTTHRFSLDGRETLAAANQVLDRSDKGSKNTNVESRKHSKSGNVWGLSGKERRRKKSSADQSLISLNPSQKCPGPSNICFFSLPHHPCYCLSWWFAWKCIRQLQIFHC